VRVLERDAEGTAGVRFMLTRSAEAFAMMGPTSLLRLLGKARGNIKVGTQHLEVSYLAECGATLEFAGVHVSWIDFTLQKTTLHVFATNNASPPPPPPPCEAQPRPPAQRLDATPATAERRGIAWRR
jgi:hypothetical protein